MKKLFFYAALAMTYISLTSLTPAGLKVRFSSQSWEETQALARQEQKLYFVDFDASYCAACRNMDQGTYMSGQLAEYMAENVVALRIDVQDFDGVVWSQQYDVEALPTMLIFNEKGELVSRLVGYKSADDLLKAFRELRTVSAWTPKPARDDAPYKPAVLPQPNAQINPPTKPLAQSLDIEVDVEIVKAKEFYELSIRKAEKQGFSLQIGAYSNYNIVLDEGTRLNKEFPNMQLYVLAEQEGKKPLYRLLLGKFDSRSRANIFRSELKRKGFDGLVRNLQTM